MLSTNEWCGLFCSSSVVGTFAAHLCSSRSRGKEGSRAWSQISTTSLWSFLWCACTFYSWGKLIKYYLFKSSTLFFSMQQILLPFRWFMAWESCPVYCQRLLTVPLVNSQLTWPVSMTLHGEIRGFIKLISKKLRPASYDKIIAGAKKLIGLSVPRKSLTSQLVNLLMSLQCLWISHQMMMKIAISPLLRMIM